MALSYGLCLGDESRKYSADEFCEALGQLTGDGVCQRGREFLASVTGLTVSLGTGFGLAEGRYLKSDGVFAVSVPPAYDHRDRVDLLALRLNREERNVELALLEDADLSALPDALAPLYSVQVKRGATSLLPADLKDLRSLISPLSSLSADGLRAYGFTAGGIEDEINRIVQEADRLCAKAEAEAARLEQVIAQAGGPAAGELTTAPAAPGPDWLLCNGGPVPAGYPQLAALMTALPNIESRDSRFKTWIYGGKEEE